MKYFALCLLFFSSCSIARLLSDPVIQKDSVDLVEEIIKDEI